MLTEGNKPQATVMRISGKRRSVDEYVQCSMILELHDNCAMCLVIRPPTYLIRLLELSLGQFSCCKNQAKKFVYFFK